MVTLDRCVVSRDQEVHPRTVKYTDPETFELEQRLRAALRARVQGAPVTSLPRLTPGQFPESTGGRRAVLIGGSAVLAVMAGLAAVAVLQPDGRSGPVAVNVAGPVAGEPEHRSAAVRVILDLPGLDPVRVDETVVSGGVAAGPGVDGFYIQSFRSPFGFSGPMVWVLTVPPPPSGRNDYGFNIGRPLTIQRSPAHLQGSGPGLRLTWPADNGGGVIVASWGLSEDAVVSFANGLRRRQAGWDATVLPEGLAVVVDSPRAGYRPPGTRVEETYRNSSGRQVQLSVTSVTPVGFEDRAMGVASARSFEAITVAGRLGLLIGEPGGGPSGFLVLWQPTDTSMAELRLKPATADDVVTREDVLAVASAIRVVDDDAWQSSLPSSTIQPDDFHEEVARLQAGAPLPSGSSWDAFEVAPVARDRPSLAEEMLTYAVCAWQRDWLSATTAGENTRADAVVNTLEKAATWPIAREAAPWVQPPDIGESLSGQMRSGDVASVRVSVTRCK